jgi:tRNA A-37 threonylcarbamoyl transferase component Bud32
MSRAHVTASSLQGAETAAAATGVVSRRAGKLRWRVRSGFLPANCAALLEKPDQFLIEPENLIAHSELVTMGVVPPCDGGPPLLLRRLNYRRLRHRLRDLFRPTRAHRAFEHGLEMEQAGVPTPRVIAAGARRILRWPVHAYLVTEFIPNARTLADVLARQNRLTWKQTRELADMMARLHSRNFSHRDLKASNILYNEQGQPCFIDLDGVRRYEKLPEVRMVRDFVRLAREFIGKDLTAVAPWFLKRYCRQRGMRTEFRTLYTAIGERLVKRLRALKIEAPFLA